jgi:tellurite resistance protein
MVSPASAKAMVDSNPLRQRRYFFSDRNPLVSAFGPLARSALDNRRKVAPDNPFLLAEHCLSESMIAFWDSYRDVRDALCEFWFTALYASPVLQALVPSESHRISETPGTDLRAVPNVHAALENIDNGGFADAVIRMLILMAHSRSAVRRDRLERSNQVLTKTEPFASLGLHTRNAIIQRQSLIVDFEPEQALVTLPLLLPDAKDRRRAMDLCRTIAGPESEMEEGTIALLGRLTEVLDLTEKEALPAGVAMSMP